MLRRYATRWIHLPVGIARAGLLLAIFWGGGQWFRDETWLTGLCFYIPSAFLAMALLFGAGSCIFQRRWRYGALCAGIAALPVGMTLFVENHWIARESGPSASRCRVVHWNVASHLDRPAVREILVARNADLYLISEIPSAVAVEALRQSLRPGFQGAAFGSMGVVAFGELRTGPWLASHDGIQVMKLVWKKDDREVVLLAVDFPSNPLVHRDPILRELRRLIDEHQPDLVLGDFNAPRRSRGLCPLPAGYFHAYDTVGAGWGYTWPVPAPMYALDQCLHSSRIIPMRYALHTSRHSDHRMQVFDFTSDKSADSRSRSAGS